MKYFFENYNSSNNKKDIFSNTEYVKWMKFILRRSSNGGDGEIRTRGTA